MIEIISETISNKDIYIKIAEVSPFNPEYRISVFAKIICLDDTSTEDAIKATALLLTSTVSNETLAAKAVSTFKQTTNHDVVVLEVILGYGEVFANVHYSKIRQYYNGSCHNNYTAKRIELEQMISRILES